MEHATVTFNGERYHMVPDEGYQLCYTSPTGMKYYYSDAEDKSLTGWSAIPLSN